MGFFLNKSVETEDIEIVFLVVNARVNIFTFLCCKDKNLFKDKGFFSACYFLLSCRKYLKSMYWLRKTCLRLTACCAVRIFFFFIVAEMSDTHMNASLSLQNSTIQQEIEVCGKHLIHWFCGIRTNEKWSARLSEVLFLYFQQYEYKSKTYFFFRYFFV